jgi:hypothetical protein
MDTNKQIHIRKDKRHDKTGQLLSFRQQQFYMYNRTKHYAVKKEL